VVVVLKGGQPGQAGCTALQTRHPPPPPARPPAHLTDDQALATVGVVHCKVQAGAEHVLVVLRIHARRHQRAVLGLGPLPG